MGKCKCCCAKPIHRASDSPPNIAGTWDLTLKTWERLSGPTGPPIPCSSISPVISFELAIEQCDAPDDIFVSAIPQDGPFIGRQFLGVFETVCDKCWRLLLVDPTSGSTFFVNLEKRTRNPKKLTYIISEPFNIQSDFPLGVASVGAGTGKKRN